MKRLFCLLMSLALLLCLFPAVVSAAESQALSLTWNQGTYYDNTINPNLVSRKYTVIDVNAGDVVTFDYPTANWAIYVYYADAQGSMGYVTSKQGANETFVVQEINGRTPTQLRLTAFHRSGSNVTITDELWATFDVVISKTGMELEPTGNIFTFATQNFGLWNDGVNQGVAADKVEERAAAWQAVMEKHGVDLLVGQEWLPYLDSEKTVSANEKVFGNDYPYLYGNNTSTYDGKNIISRTPLSNISYTTMVSNVGRRYAKAYTTIGGKTVCIIDAHLSFEEDINVNRKEEMVELLNLAQGEKYVIIAGDFNVFTADEFEIFEEAGYSLANAGAFGEFNTWPNLGRNPTAEVNRVIDNIIVSPGIRINNAWVEDTKLSDHALLAAELELLEEGEFEDNRLLCEHCGQFVQWKPCNLTNGGTANAILESGHYYFPNDLPKLTGAFFIGNKTSAFPDVVLDLRGHALTSTSRAFYVRGGGSKLSLVDTVGCGTATTNYTSTGGVVYVEGGSTFNLYDGSLSNTGAPTTDRKGGNIYAETSALVNIYGGEIYGGKASHGCAIYGGNKNIINISGGSLYGNTATSAGGVVYMNGGTLNMTGGTVTGGQAVNGGGMYLYATNAYLTGGQIFGNTGTNGGNVHTAGNSNSSSLYVGNCNIANADIYVSSSGKACLTTKEAIIKDAAGKNVTTSAGDMVLYVGGCYTVHDHNMVTDIAVAPTCTATGLTEGKHCTGCDTQTTAQEEIPANGHTWGEGVYTEPTYDADGFTTFTCTACSETKVEVDEGSKLPEIIANTIIKHPEAVSVDSGNDVQFKVEATGEVVSYKWEYRKLYKWFNTSMTGYNTDTLTVAATGQRNNYGYRCIVTFADGTVLISEEAKLTVKTYMEITYQPNDQTVVLGYKGQFTAAAEGEGIKYQWQYCRPGSELWIDTAMEGATKATVFIESTTARDGYMYRCRITDVTGNEQFTEVATMRVLSFTAHPQETFAANDDTVQFTVSTNVSEGFSYQWQYRRNATANWTNTTLTGYNTDTLTVPTSGKNGYEYRCVLTGSKNSKIESKGAVLHVGAPVMVTAQPTDATAAVGETVPFTVAADNAFTYQWQYQRPGSTAWNNTGAEGNQTATLQWPAKSSNNGYKFRCVIYGLDGVAYYSDAATLTIG